MAIVSVQTCWGADALGVGVIHVDENQCKEKEKKDLLGWMRVHGCVGVRRRIGRG